MYFMQYFIYVLFCNSLCKYFIYAILHVPYVIYELYAIFYVLYGILYIQKMYVLHAIHFVRCCIYLTTYDWITSFLKITIERRAIYGNLENKINTLYLARRKFHSKNNAQ